MARVCGTRGAWHAFNIQTQPGSLSSDLQIRGALNADPDPDARQFITIMALSESIFDIEYQNGSPLPVITQYQNGSPLPVITRVSPLS